MILLGVSAVFVLVQIALRYFLGKAALNIGTIVLGLVPFATALLTAVQRVDDEHIWENQVAALFLAGAGALTAVVLGAGWFVLRRGTDVQSENHEWS